MPAAKVEADLAQWRPILGFVEPVLRVAAEPEAKPASNVLPKPAAKPAVHKPSRPVLPPGSLPSGSLRPQGVSADAELTAARTAPGALEPLPQTDAPAINGHEPVNGKPTEAPKIQRLVPVSPAEELDSHFGGLTTRIGRWLESLSVKRAR